MQHNVHSILYRFFSSVDEQHAENVNEICIKAAQIFLKFRLNTFNY